MILPYWIYWYKFCIRKRHFPFKSFYYNKEGDYLNNLWCRYYVKWCKERNRRSFNIKKENKNENEKD